MSFDKRTPFLVLGSIMLSVLVCEMGLRLFTQYGASPSPEAAADKLLDAGDGMRYVARLGAVPGTDRQWFTEDPPLLTNRFPVGAQSEERIKDFERRGIFALEADYIWNRRYAEVERCLPNNVFRNYPDKVLAFEPPAEDPHPRYRFPPNTAMAAGMVTNEFGLRGPPLTLAKPAKTVRIAFVGASTTVGYPQFRFSYPERVVYWLNRFAAANQFDARFEALNAGRFGLNSEDMVPIVRDELLPLDPDLAVYYEGSNQFTTANAMVWPPTPPRLELDARDPIVEHKVPELIRAHSATGDLLDRALNGFNSVGEPRKPLYFLRWPIGADEQNPDVNSPNLPLQLPIIVKDLDLIRNSLESIGSQLVLCSFEWLVKDGMPLSARHRYIYKQLNTTLWPLRYADIRRLADFQNRVFRRYAATRSIPFLDVASSTPQDPNLFEDAIHMTEAGDRLRAWIVFQKLVPLIRSQLESGKLPRAIGSRRLSLPPSPAVFEMSVRCNDAPSGGPLVRLDGSLSLDSIQLVYDEASIQHGRPVKIVTAGQQWTFAAALPIDMPAGLTGPSFVFLRARVVNGEIGIGIVDRNNNSYQAEKRVAPSSRAIEIYVPVPFPERAGALIIRNTAAGGARSEILIEDAALMASSKPPSEPVVQTMRLDRVQLAYSKASLERGQEGLIVTTGPERNAFAGRAPLGLDSGDGAKLTVHVRARVLRGTIGFGVLSPDNKVFLQERWLWPTSEPKEVALPLPSPPVTGDLIIWNAALGNTASKAIVEKIEVSRAP